jgi:PAS domain S-box-containing protein
MSLSSFLPIPDQWLTVPGRDSRPELPRLKRRAKRGFQPWLSGIGLAGSYGLIASERALSACLQPAWDAGGVVTASVVWDLRDTLLLAGLLGLVTLFVFAWVGMLRRQVRLQTEIVRQEKNLLSTLIDHLPDNVFVKDIQGRFVLTNRAHTRFHGAGSSNVLLGKLTSEVCSPDFSRAYCEADEKILAGILPLFEAEEPARDYRGDLRCLSTIKVPLKDDTGKIIGLVGISRDVTGRRKAEEALKQSEQFTRSLVSHLPQNILHKDLEGRFTFVNDFFCRTVNRPIEQILGRTDFDLYPAELAKKFRRDDQAVLERGKIFRTVEENRDVSGETTYVEVIKSPLFGPDNHPVGLQVIFWDVTPQKQAEAQLAYERDLLKALLDNYPDSIYFKNLQSQFVRVSRSKLERSFLVARSRYAIAQASPEFVWPQHLRDLESFSLYLPGKTDFDFFERDRAQSAYEDEQEIIRTGQLLAGKVEKALLPDGKVYWSLSTKMPWRDPEGRLIGTFGISKDITAIKEAEETLASVHRQLVETSRQAGMAEVASHVLHNVGNVLNSVNVSANLLAEKVRHSKAVGLRRAVALMHDHAGNLGDFMTLDPRGRQLPVYLEQLADRLGQEQNYLSAEITSLGRNIDHIKNIVAMQQGYAKAVGVTESIAPIDLVEEALRIDAPSLAERRIRVRREYPGVELPRITVEKHKALQILVNLLRNAGLACAECQRPDKEITVRVDLGDGHIRIAVQDNGIGIPEENLARLFNLGFTTRKDGHGFGLHSGALAAKELGGALHVHSQGPGLGATFCLDLPLSPPPVYA